MNIVYSPQYNIWTYGLQGDHPFDTCRAGNVWRLLRKSLGSKLCSLSLPVQRPASAKTLRPVHTPAYLDSLRNSATIASIVELPGLARIPAWLLDAILLRPMRWATAGSIVAAEAAIKDGLAVNLAGGFHHAAPDHGEGFCFYNDIALAVRHVRTNGLVTSMARVAYIDLDVHQGNGVCRAFRDDPTVFLFDMFNEQIYPAFDLAARQRIDCAIPLQPETTGSVYLATLKERLPQFLDSISQSAPIELAVYNAGTDVFVEDPLGGLRFSAADVLERDYFVVSEIRRRGIPTVMLPSGGYTSRSARLIAASIVKLADL